MHLFRQHAVKDPASVSDLIPMVDFGPYFAGEPGALARLAQTLRHACENVGFLYAANHGVPETVIDRGFAASRRFHALPLEQKLKLRLNENNIGYLAMNASVQGASTVHKATKPIETKVFSSAMIAERTIPMSSRAFPCAAGTSGRTGCQACARI